jgi:hypothetical protein
MKNTITTFLGGLLVCTLFTTALAGSNSPKPVDEKPVLEKRVRRLEQMMQTMQKQVEALENVVYQTDPICPCFGKEEIQALTLESCVVTQDGAIKGKGKQVTVSVAKDSCAIRTADGSVDLPITPQEQWVCAQPLLGKVATQSLPCSVE